MTDPTPAVPSGDAADSQQTTVPDDLDQWWQSLGQRIKNARKAAGYTQVHMADAMGLTRTSIVNIEAGRQRINAHSVLFVAEVLGVPVAHLLEGTRDAADSQQTDSLDAVLRAARDDLHAQTDTPYHQARKREFLRRLEAGEFDNAPFAEGGDIPAGDSAASSSASVEWIKTAIGELPEWQQHWLRHLAELRSREQRRAGYEANAAFQRGMQIASGRDVPPLPATDLPTRVDDLTSDTYDQLRARYAWLEQRYRDTVDSEQGAMVVRQAKEIGELRRDLDDARMWARHGYEIGQRSCLWSDYGVAPAWLTEGLPRHDAGACEHLNGAVAEYDLRIAAERTVARVRTLHRRVPQYTPADRCPCAYPDDQQHQLEDEYGDRMCTNSPLGEQCASCEQHWPCPTIRALGQTSDDTTETT